MFKLLDEFRRAVREKLEAEDCFDSQMNGSTVHHDVEWCRRGPLLDEGKHMEAIGVRSFTAHFVNRSLIYVEGKNHGPGGSEQLFKSRITAEIR